MGAEQQLGVAGRYTLTPRTLIFITRGEQFLLLKGSPSKRLWAGLYNGIGGHIERGEDALSAARRELSEEAGLTGVDLWLAGLITVDTGGSPGILLFVFRGELPEPAAQAPLAAGEEGTLEWVEMSLIDGLPTVEDLPALLPRLRAARREAPPFFGHYRYDDQNRLVMWFNQAG